MPGSLVPSTWVGRAVAGLLVWYVVMLLTWGVRPLTDNVPLVVSPEAPAGTVVDSSASTQAVECGSPLAGGGVDGELPTLDPYMLYGRKPCSGPEQSARWLLVLDTVVLGAGVAGLGWLAVRRRSDGRQEYAPV